MFSRGQGGLRTLQFFASLGVRSLGGVAPRMWSGFTMRLSKLSEALVGSYSGGTGLLCFGQAVP